MNRWKNEKFQKFLSEKIFWQSEMFDVVNIHLEIIYAYRYDSKVSRHVCF